MNLRLLCVLACLVLVQINNISAQTEILTNDIIETNLSSPIQESIDTLNVLENISISENSGQFYLNASNAQGLGEVSVNGNKKFYNFENGKATMEIAPDQKGELVMLKTAGETGRIQQLTHVAKVKDGFRVKEIPLWLSLLPPLVAIFLALIFKEVIISLFIGIWAGAFIVGGLRIESLYYFLHSIFETVSKYIISAVNDAGHISIIVFSMLIGGMVGIISKNGGMAGVVHSLSRYAKSPTSAQFITWLLGLAIFFDDYANTLIVGNTMRPVTDKFNVSREKLAYIIDSTAAPVAAIAFITTWIGAELGYIDDGIKMLPYELDITAYGIFISSLKYSFYPVLTLIFLVMIILMKKDYGPMLKAETRSYTTGRVSSAKNEAEDEPDMEDLSPVKNAPLRWYNAAIPVAVVILMTIYGLIDTGMDSLYSKITTIDNAPDLFNSWSSVWQNIHLTISQESPGFFSKLGKLIGSADSYVALLWASFSGVVAAIILTVSQRIMNLFDTMHWMTTGFKTMLPAFIILVLAWSLAITTDELHTADYLSRALENSISPYLFPMIIFVMAAFIAFSTGSSWSTMAILYPIAIPTTFAICNAQGIPMEETLELLFNVISTVLAASVLGDHCSPISDTTILSSLASDCNHIDHVRTQLPYALTVGVTSISCVGISALLGGGWLLSLILVIISVVLFYFIIKIFGKTAMPEN